LRITSSSSKLSNEKFVNNAPEKVVNEEREKLKKYHINSLVKYDKE